MFKNSRKSIRASKRENCTISVKLTQNRPSSSLSNNAKESSRLKNEIYKYIQNENHKNLKEIKEGCRKKSKGRMSKQANLDYANLEKKLKNQDFGRPKASHKHQSTAQIPKNKSKKKQSRKKSKTPRGKSRKGKLSFIGSNKKGNKSRPNTGKGFYPDSSQQEVDVMISPSITQNNKLANLNMKTYNTLSQEKEEQKD